MAVKVIIGRNDPEFSSYEDQFQHFCPDDWDYMIIGDNRTEVEDLADILGRYDFNMLKFDDLWIAVTYHS